jgi:hypothetical protein
MVSVGACSRLRRRISIGSRPSSAAIVSSSDSKAKRMFTVPWPRIAPQGGVLV